MGNFKAGWYLIYTKPRHERKLSAQFEQKKVQHYLPTTKVIRKWNDRNKIIEEPLFPSYVFVYLDNMHDYYNVLDADGSLFYVKFGREIATIHPKIIEDLRMVVDNGKNIQVTSMQFQSGHQLVIKEGPFTGMTCEVVEHENERKILVRVQLLNRNVLASLPSADVACANCYNSQCRGQVVCLPNAGSMAASA